MSVAVARALVALAGAGALVCTGCVGSSVEVFPAGTGSVMAPIEVARQDITPTVSMDAQVVAAPSFSVLSPTSGVVSRLVASGTAVRAGELVAMVGNRAVRTPVDGVVASVSALGDQSVPANLPLAAIRYSGFALKGRPASWAAGVFFQSVVTGRGQINDADPSDCAALAPAAGSDESGSWLCLLPKDRKANEALGGVVVATGVAAHDVVVVPLSAVAGRQGSGEVTLITPGGPQIVKVTLGITDGVNVEITNGLSAGDMISPLAPDLSLKSQR